MKRRLAILGACMAAGLAFVAGVLPYALPSILARIRPDIVFAVPTTERRLFLTIDDAPSENTEAILAVLREQNVPAVFFVTSGHVQSPEQLKRIVASGHALGHHMKTTTACSKLSQENFQRDFDDTAALLRAVGPAHLFRPPSDFGTPAQIAHARQQGWTPVMGTVFPLDHWIESRRSLVTLSRWLAVNGGIIILHDGRTRGATTAKVLATLIPKLKAAGYSFGKLQEVVP